MFVLTVNTLLFELDMMSDINHTFKIILSGNNISLEECNATI